MYKLSVIGVGNMAKAIIGGIVSSSCEISSITLFDKFTTQYEDLKGLDFDFEIASDLNDAVSVADIVLLSVKPQNYDEVLEEISTVGGHSSKTYISIAAGITAETVSEKLDGANVIRVLPNLPMVIGQGVSLICRNDSVPSSVFKCISDIFASSGSVKIIDESEMNRLISVTSSSPAYVFKFVDAIHKGALAQGLEGDDLIPVICDVLIGSAMLLKSSNDTPSTLASKVASKGGTTEQALNKLNELGFDEIIKNAMIACTVRADELGNVQK